MDMKRKKYLPIHFVYCRGRNVVREKKKRLSQNKFEMASIVSFQIEVICIFFKKRNLQARF